MAYKLHDFGGHVEVWHPDSLEPSPDELKEFERLKAFIEAAVADGKLSSSEMASIKAQARADGKITLEELELYRKLVAILQLFNG